MGTLYADMNLQVDDFTASFLYDFISQRLVFTFRLRKLLVHFTNIKKKCNYCLGNLHFGNHSFVTFNHHHNHLPFLPNKPLAFLIIRDIKIHCWPRVWTFLFCGHIILMKSPFGVECLLTALKSCNHVTSFNNQIERNQPINNASINQWFEAKLSTWRVWLHCIVMKCYKKAKHYWCPWVHALSKDVWRDCFTLCEGLLIYWYSGRNLVIIIWPYVCLARYNN